MKDKKHHVPKKEGNSEIPEEINIALQKYQVTIQPQKNWLTKRLPNLGELLATIPISSLVSKEDELQSQQDFNDIRFKVKKIKVENQHEDNFFFLLPEM